MAVTGPPPPGHGRVLTAVRSGGLVVALAAAFGVFGYPFAAALVGGACMVALAVVGRGRGEMAALGGLILIAIVAYRARIDPTPPNWNWLPLLLAGAVVAGLASERIESRELRPLRRRESPDATRGLGRQGVVLLIVALVAAAIGAQFALPADGGASSGSELARADSSSLNAAVLPYLGLEHDLNTAVRGRLGNDVVLRVRAPAPDFWRGQSFDEWDGRVWTRSEHIDDVENARQPIEPPVDVQRFKQHVQVEASAIGVLYGAYRPLFANLPPTSYVRMADGAMRLSHPLGRGTQYTMVSLRPVVTEAELRTHDPRGPGADAPTALAPRAGRAASPRVARLAARITAGAPTTYDAIRALERWLATHTTYTLDIPPLPRGADAVDQFLFVDHKGFCVQIATSMTVMLRSLGVLARLGTGFAPGDESLLGGEFTVRGKDAHAWVEVWFPGLGWQAFDPTAEVPLSGDYDGSFLARLVRLVGRAAVPLIVAIAVGTGLVLMWVAVRRARRRRSRTWVSRIYRRVQREGKARGRPRRPSETPRQYLDALSRSVVPSPEQLDVVARVITDAAYAPEEPDEGERARAEESLSLALSAPVSASSPSRP